MRRGINVTPQRITTASYSPPVSHCPLILLPDILIMTPSMLTLTTPDSDFVPHPHAEAMVPGIGGFPISDRMLFLAGYSELCRVDLAGRRVLEICGGDGKLSVALAEGFPKAEVIALDLYKADGGALANRAKQLRGLSFMAGNAFDLG